MTFTAYKKYPEPLLTHNDNHVLRELMDIGENHMGSHTSFYIEEIKKIVQKQSN